MPGPAAAAVIAPIAGQVASFAKNSFPYLDDEAIVRVYGQPGASKKQLYYLAMATAFGLVKRFDAAQWASPPPGMLAISYSSENMVEVTLRYKTNLLSSVLAAGTGNTLGRWQTWVTAAIPVIGPIIVTNQLAVEAGQTFIPAPQSKPLPLYTGAAVYNGPPEEVVGGAFNFVGALTPGIPTSSESIGAPKLPFAGRVITTTQPRCKDPNPDIADPASAPVIPAPHPKPAGDNRSRGVVFTPADASGETLPRYLVPILRAALTNPNVESSLNKNGVQTPDPSQKTFPVPVAGPRGG
jgi:hypothetical protein